MKLDCHSLSLQRPTVAADDDDDDLMVLTPNWSKYTCEFSWCDKLQRAQNNLARVVCQSRGLADTRSLLHSLHWLSVMQAAGHL